MIYRIALLFNAFAVTCSSGLDDVPSYEELRKRLMSNIKSAERQGTRTKRAWSSRLVLSQSHILPV